VCATSSPEPLLERSQSISDEDVFNKSIQSLENPQTFWIETIWLVVQLFV
jgi:hypothetical protein